MTNKNSVINNFCTKGYLYEPFCDKMYTAVLFAIKFNIPLNFVKRLIVKRYQSGEVNNMKYADSVVITNPDFVCNFEKRIVLFSTNDLGYGKSINPVTYHVQVIPEISIGDSGESFFECSEIICTSTPGEIRINA